MQTSALFSAKSMADVKEIIGVMSPSMKYPKDFPKNLKGKKIKNGWKNDNLLDLECPGTYINRNH